MDREFEIAGAASAGGWLRWRKSHVDLPPGTPCENCATVLQGPYCHACGQLAENFERSVWGLLVEGIESFFHFDGRFWQTLPRLAWKPGALTRDYLAGKRAFQIPPLRLFLVVLVVVFFAGGVHLGPKKVVEVKTVDQLKPAERAKVEAALAKAHLKISAVSGVPSSLASVTVTPDAPADASKPAVNVVAARPPGAHKDRPLKGFSAWVHRQAKLAVANPELFTMILESWGHRFAILMLPISALFLSGLFVFQKRFYVFDHMIFSMHSLSFQGLLFSLIFLLSQLTDFAMLLIFLSPVHLFVHMRGAYQTSILGTLLRMTLLFIGTVVAVTFLMIGLLWVGLSAMSAH